MLTEPNQRATTFKSQESIEISVDCWKNSENKLKLIKIFPRNKNNDANNSNAKSNVNNPNNNNGNSNRAVRKPKTVYPPCETCGKTNHSTEKCYHGANAGNRPPVQQRRPERQNQVQERANQNESNETIQVAGQNCKWKCHVFTPELRLTDRR